MLQDPWGEHTAGSGAKVTNEVGVLNPDPTARACKAAIESAGLSIAETLPLNAIPWIDGKVTRDQLREGAAYNRTQILASGVSVVVLAGKAAQRSEEFLDLSPSIEVRYAPHPSIRGLANCFENGRRLSIDEAQKWFYSAFLIIDRR